MTPDTLCLDGNQPQRGYTIQNILGCRVVFGSVPAREFSTIVHGFSHNAVMDIDLADRLGATFVLGEPAALDDLRQLELPISEKRLTECKAAKARGLDALALWLRNGERGESSNAMAKRIFGLPTDASNQHPYDPADLRRCLGLLDATHAHDHVHLMRDVSPAWATLVSSWDKLRDSLMEELANGKSAPKTYALMHELLKSH